MKSRKNKEVLISGHAGRFINETTFRNMASDQGHGFVRGDLNNRMFLPYLGEGHAVSGRPRIRR